MYKAIHKKKHMIGGRLVIIPYKAVGGMLTPVRRMKSINGKKHFVLPYREPSQHKTMTKQTKTAQDAIESQMARVRII